jgi:predicted metal-dependent enzyme (double-stranded beta helix superfamily)
MVGVLHGSEKSQRYRYNASGCIQPVGREVIHHKGSIECVSPSIGDIHTVSNAYADKPSISIHIYGANIGTISRHVFKPGLSQAIDFTSGYNPIACPLLTYP